MQHLYRPPTWHPRPRPKGLPPISSVNTSATTLTFTVSGGTSLTGLKGAVFTQATPDLWTAPIKNFDNETTDGSGVCSIDIAGLGVTIGALCAVFLTNSDGTSTAGGTQSSTRRALYVVATAS